MVQRRNINSAAMMDVLKELRREEYAGRTVPKWRGSVRNAALRDVPNK